MTCTCGYEAKSTILICCNVQIITFHCSKCSREGRILKIVGRASRNDLLSWLEKAYAGNRVIITESRKMVIDYLERLLDTSEEYQEKVKTSRQKFEDMWERKYLKTLLQEDYYS